MSLNRAALEAEVAANFPDNTSGLITPAILRQTTDDILIYTTLTSDVNDFSNYLGSGSPLVNIVDPTNAQDAATKHYVDNHTPATPNLQAVTTIGDTWGYSANSLNADGSIGVGASQSGPNSTAIGRASAAANSSTALGQGAYANASSSIALGQGAHASGNNSIALGQGAHATGNNSIALGQGVHTSGNNSIALGQGAHALGASTAIGQGAYALYNGSTALGQGSQANDVNATALGYGANAYGNNSTALGQGAYAYGVNATALGQGANASIDNTIVLGTNAETVICPGKVNMANLPSGTTIPGGLSTGDLWWNTTTNIINIAP